VKIYKSKLYRSIYNLADIFFSVATRRITLKYGFIRLSSLVLFTGRRFVDGVNWGQYHKHYVEELKITKRTHTILVSREEIDFYENRIRYKKTNIKPLIMNHELLYETILKLNVTSVLEAGCGGGDHLHNLHELSESLALNGIDYLDSQLKTFENRNPVLYSLVKPSQLDLTQPNLDLPPVELIFTQAVLMHISERNNRFMTAFENLFQSKCTYIVLMENWNQHNFFMSAQYILKHNHAWRSAQFYYNFSDRDPQTRCLIISKKVLNFPVLRSYDDLLQGEDLAPH
jgi:SAM-dependent methyltransferase